MANGPLAWGVAFAALLGCEGVPPSSAWSASASSASPASSATPIGDGDQPRSHVDQRSEPVVDAGPHPQPTRDVTGAEAARRAHHAISDRQLGAPLPSSPLVAQVQIENPEGLAAFHAGLRRLEKGEEADGKVRVVVYGASSTAGDRYTGYLRGYLQHRFGDGGPGFVALVPLWRGHRHQETKAVASRGWTITHSLRPRGRADGRYGLMGVRATAPYAGARVRLRVVAQREPATRWEVWYLTDPRGGRFDVSLDGDAAKSVATRADGIGPGYAVVTAPGPRRELALRTRSGGAVRLFGAVIENAAPGVVVDELGIGGSGARRQLHWDEALWAEHIARRDPELFVLAYGGIEAMRKEHDPARWRAELEKILDRFARAIPKASCLVISPQDLALRGGRKVRRRPRGLDSIIAVMREVATARGCAFFDTHAMMGGSGAMRRWVAAKLAKPDHVHFTPRGYAHLGRALADAVMADYDAGP